jgi:hypothetical protein
MKSKEFDKLVREKFDNAGLPYNPENWQKLSATLDEKESRRKRFLLWPMASLAASVALAIGIATWLNRGDNSELQVKRQPANAVEKPVVARNPAPAVQNKEEEKQETAPALRPAQQASRLTFAQTAPGPATANAIPAVIQEIIPAPKQLPEEISPLEPEAIAVAKLNDETVGTFKAKTDLMPPVVPQAGTHSSMTNANVFHEEMRVAGEERKKYITMAGGLNYGSLNSGYVMGFSAGTKINNRLYVESDVAFVGNIAGNKTSRSFTTVEAADALAKSTSSFVNTTTVTTTKYYNFYYAQLTPTIGYRVSRNLSVGAGPDVQRLLMNHALVTEGDNPKKLPVYDMGLVGKTEYSLTREIKAGLYYRKGFNQALNSDNQLLDRDYLQLQLKFTILNR